MAWRAVFVGLVCLYPVGSVPAGEWKPAAGGRAPSFTLSDLTGAERSLDGWRGRPVLLHFFATWCAPCRPEMEALARLRERVPDTTLAIVAVSVAEPDLRVQRFFADAPAPFPVLLDRDRAASRAYGVDSLPTSFILDAALTRRLVVEEDLAWDTLDVGAVLAELARRPAPEPSSNRPTE